MIATTITVAAHAWIASDTPLGLPSAAESIARKRIVQPKNSATVQSMRVRFTALDPMSRVGDQRSTRLGGGPC